LHDRLRDLIYWLQDKLILTVYFSPLCLLVLLGPEEEYDFWANCFGGDTPEGWLGTLINMSVMFGFIFCFLVAGDCFLTVTKPLWIVENTDPNCGHTYEVSRFGPGIRWPPICDTCVFEEAMEKSRLRFEADVNTTESEPTDTDASDSE
jgi:hypothetical protein